MLTIVAWINLVAGLAGAAIAFMAEALPLAFGLAVGAITLFAVLRGLDEIIGLLESIRYNTRRKE